MHLEKKSIILTLQSLRIILQSYSYAQITGAIKPFTIRHSHFVNTNIVNKYHRCHSLQEFILRAVKRVPCRSLNPLRSIML